MLMVGIPGLCLIGSNLTFQDQRYFGSHLHNCLAHAVCFADVSSITHSEWPLHSYALIWTWSLHVLVLLALCSSSLGLELITLAGVQNSQFLLHLGCLGGHLCFCEQLSSSLFALGLLTPQWSVWGGEVLAPLPLPVHGLVALEPIN